MPNLPAIGVAAVLAAAGAAAALAPARPAPAAGDPDPGKLFGERCASCHTVPDPSLAPGRAWIEQARVTA